MLRKMRWNLFFIELENGKRSMKMEPHGGEEFGYVLEGKSRSSLWDARRDC